MKNALTIDLEDYFHVTAFADRLSMDEWKSQESRIYLTTEKILNQLAEAKCTATFFVLGWLAEYEPGLIARIVQCGHELGCHSYSHSLVYQLTISQFREDTRRAKEMIENASGRAVRGYRAPSFSLRPEAREMFDVLAELNFAYDSSIFPVQHPNYGSPKAPRFAFQIQTQHGPIIEFPLPTLTFGGIRTPIGGGAYMRILPYAYTRWALRFINNREHQPFCVYFHPWEVDPEQPRVRGSLTARIRHYAGLDSMESKIRNLLRDFQFCSLAQVVEELRFDTTVRCMS